MCVCVSVRKRERVRKTVTFSFFLCSCFSLGKSLIRNRILFLHQKRINRCFCGPPHKPTDSRLRLKMQKIPIGRFSVQIPVPTKNFNPRISIKYPFRAAVVVTVTCNQEIVEVVGSDPAFCFSLSVVCP